MAASLATVPRSVRVTHGTLEFDLTNWSSITGFPVWPTQNATTASL